MSTQKGLGQVMWGHLEGSDSMTEKTKGEGMLVPCVQCLQANQADPKVNLSMQKKAACPLLFMLVMSILRSAGPWCSNLLPLLRNIGHNSDFQKQE